MEEIENESPLVCIHCGTSLADWQGNVMVSFDEYFRKHHVTKVSLWCKTCTRESDRAGRTQSLHAVWELEWYRDRPLNIALGLMYEMSIPPDRVWEEEAISTIAGILRFAHPKIAESIF